LSIHEVKQPMGHAFAHFSL